MDERAALAALQEMRAYFQSGATRSVSVRIAMLETLHARMTQMEAELLSALHEDLGKGEAEGYMTEIGLVKSEIRLMQKRLPKLARIKRVGTPLMLFPGKSYLYPEPYGVCLVLSPWNYPVQLSLMPLVGALAAGNCVLLKPSSYAPNVSAALKRLLSCFPSGLVQVVEGGRAENQALLKAPFDFIFFTGGSYVGKQVLHAAADNLVPCVLELGGKSPCLVLEDADIELTARRLIYGKVLNAGQTCVAPDYVLVQKGVHDALLAALERQAKALCPRPLEDPLYPKIINRKHFQRLTALLQGHIPIGGQYDAQSLKIAPSVIDHADAEHPAMQEEIFGPILPILQVDSLDEAIAFVRERPKPLALYLFTKSEQAKRRVRAELSFGGGCVNDVILHLTNEHLPFGGVGASGMGSYHGEKSFETFTHYKSILDRGLRPDISVRYMPFTKEKLSVIKRLM